MVWLTLVRPPAALTVHVFVQQLQLPLRPRARQSRGCNSHYHPAKRLRLPQCDYRGCTRTGTRVVTGGPYADVTSSTRFPTRFGVTSTSTVSPVAST